MGDLAGLTPEMISSALQFKFMNEELGQKKASDLVDMIYKGALTRKALRPERTTAMKNYDAYLAQQEKLGLEPKPFESWDKDTRTSYEKHFERYKAEGGELGWDEWLRDITALGGGLELEEFTKRKEATADVKARKYFTDPEGLVADVDKFINSKETRNNLIQYADDPYVLERETVRAKEKFIRRKIAAFGEIVDARLEGRTFVFTVKWKDGTTSEVRYAN